MGIKPIEIGRNDRETKCPNRWSAAESQSSCHSRLGRNGRDTTAIVQTIVLKHKSSCPSPLNHLDSMLIIKIRIGRIDRDTMRVVQTIGLRHNPRAHAILLLGGMAEAPRRLFKPLVWSTVSGRMSLSSKAIRKDGDNTDWDWEEWQRHCDGCPNH